MSWKMVADIMGHIGCNRSIGQLGRRPFFAAGRIKCNPHLSRSTSSPIGRRGYVKVQCGLMEEQGIVLRNSYDASVNARYWETRPVSVTSRFIQIGFAFSTWYLRSRVRGNAAADFRDVLTQLGPAFVKIGQAVSSRPDVVSPEYLRELEKLQDQIPPFPDEAAFATIQEELGRPASELFSEISEAPIAAASLGQVYKAVLKRCGSSVAVKVQRPGVVEQIALDVYILRRIAAFVKEWRKLNSDLPALIDEWATSLFRELDYQREADNGIKFQELFGKMKGVYVPKMMKEVTTAKVLVMEWVDGEKLRSGTRATEDISRTGSLDDLRLVSVGVTCSLEQMLEEGFYHADPHPGNLLRMRDGRLCYLDFGMMGQINRTTRQALVRATLHLVNREFEALSEDFVTLGFLPPGSEKEQIVPALTGVFEAALASGVSNLSFSDLSVNLGQTMYQYKFQIPAYYTLLVRSLTVLEGIAIASDPNYKVLSAAYPWVARRLLTDKSEELRETLRALLYKDKKFQFKRLQALLTQAIQSPERGNTLVSDSDMVGEDGVVISGKPLQFLLKDEGEFVREILTDEVAKGMDAAWRLGLDNLISHTRSVIVNSIKGGPWGKDDMGSPVSGQANLVQVVESILELPALAEDEDKEQVEGIWHLAQAMQRIGDGQEAGTSQAGHIQEAAMALSWLVQEIEGLPDEAREEAKRIPATLAGKVSSRLFARAIRASVGALSNGSEEVSEEVATAPA
ncbi:hypothetical protein BSKO_08426 [Bryopsis sp. KO-2023]|nr:hypothetical protein BSKO_08426 [Bryopsis sp. KO-2023]